MPKKSAAALAANTITIEVRGDMLARMGKDPAAYALEAIEMRLARGAGTISSTEFADRTRALGIPRTSFAQLAGYSPGYVQRVAEGRQPVTPGMLRALEEMERDKKLGRDVIEARRARRETAAGAVL